MFNTNLNASDKVVLESKQMQHYILLCVVNKLFLLIVFVHV